METLESNGYALAKRVLDRPEAAALAERIGAAAGPGRAGSRRNVLAVPAVRRVASDPRLRRLVEPVLGGGAQAVRGILFDKAADANWGVGWHQDLMIAVAERREAPGFTAWSVKAGVVHVKPPPPVLGRMVTVRLHLDDCGPGSGPLRVLPGTHDRGVLTSGQIAALLADREPEGCFADAGDVLLMRPLLLHASSRAERPSRRRVLHLEYAAERLPAGLR